MQLSAVHGRAQAHLTSSGRLQPQSSTGRLQSGQSRPTWVGRAARGLPLPGLTNQSLQTLIDLGDQGDENIKLRDSKSTSYVSRRRLDDADFDVNAVDEDGLPLVYNEVAISEYWGSKPGELLARWTKFTAISGPWLAKLANAFFTGRLEERQVELARDAVNNLEKLGPTFIKLGQILSVRPDVLPPPIMAELAVLQDKIQPFSTQEARQMIEQELGQSIDEIFNEISAEPVAAASLAQVYRARLRCNGEEVAVKVQRPNAIATISKDLYVLRRAVGTYERIVRTFTAQTTDYQQLVSTFAEGLYTEMDFRNEALNALRMKEVLEASPFDHTQVVVPQPYMEYTTRRVMVMQWIPGVKLTTLPPAEIRQMIKVGQEVFLTQLLDVGFIHGDSHPGNLLKVTEGPDAGKLAIIDFGLVVEIPPEDREAMVSAVIHLANKDWNALIDDFIDLKFLPQDCDRGQIIPVMDRVLAPYLRGGGAKSFNFQALSQDLLATVIEIPFSVPPSMSLLARCVATLEGVALVGDPDYQMVAQAYPFVVRKVLRNESDGSGELLRDILYDGSGMQLKPTRLSAMLNAGLGYVADAKQTEGFIDLDAVPDDGASVREVVDFLLSPPSRQLRPLLVAQLVNALDLFMRDRLRRAFARLPTLVPRLPFVGALLPAPPPLPIPVPGLGLLSQDEFLNRLAPPLTQSEEVYLQQLVDVAAGVLGVQPSDLESPSLTQLLSLAVSPSEQIQELTEALDAVVGSESNSQAAREMAEEVVELLAKKQADRAGVPVATLFGPALDIARSAIRTLPARPLTPAPSATRSPKPRTPSPTPPPAAPATGAANTTQSRGPRAVPAPGTEQVDGAVESVDGTAAGSPRPDLVPMVYAGAPVIQ